MQSICSQLHCKHLGLKFSKSISSSVPRAVGNLHLVPQPGLTDSVAGLLASWLPGEGDLDMYIVSLLTVVS